MMYRYVTIVFVATLIGCGSPELVPVPSDAGPCDAAFPGDASDLVLACTAGRNVQFPCITADGTSLRHGECCAIGENLGTCIAFDKNDQPLPIPYCDTLR